MGCIAVEDVSQGMVLSEDVRDSQCRLLLSKGQTISAKHLRILKIWGVYQVNVAGDTKRGDEAPEPADSAHCAKVQAATDKVFQNLPLDHEVIQVVYQAALAYREAHNGTGVAGQRPQLSPVGDLKWGADEIRRCIAKRDLQLPDAPAIINELNGVIADPFATSNDVARVVNKSPTLATLLLKIVNSAFYGFPSKIDRISRAVTIIGTKEISTLALGISVMRVFNDISPQIIDLPSFIRHSLACGLIARIIAAQNNVVETEQIAVSGLLHDIGKLIVWKYYPDAAAAAFAHAAANGSAVYQSEKAIMGIHHTQIAKQLLRQWKLPAALEGHIVCHHQPSDAPDPSKAAIVQMADIIANALGLGHSGEQCIPAFDGNAWDKLGIPACNINVIIHQALHQLGSMDFAIE